MMKLTDKQKEMIINFGAFHYAPEKMALIIDLPIAEIIKEIKNKKSEFYRLYMEGKSKADYLIDKKLFELAKAGDLKALEEFEYRKKTKK